MTDKAGGSTLERINKAAAEEFLANGFQKSSLRRIVKNAGVTTGAFYGYYGGKEELFNALAAPADRFMEDYRRVQRDFAQLSPSDQLKGMGVTSSEWMMKQLPYLYDNITAFKLVLQCSEGTKYANFLDKMVRVEVEATHKFYGVLRALGRNVPDIDKDLEHVIVSGMFASYFELIIHKFPREKSHEYLRQMCEFYSAGWAKLMAIDNGIGG